MLYIARNSGKNGTLVLFKEKPTRSTDNRYWVVSGSEDKFPKGLFSYLVLDLEDLFPNLRWEDEPIEIDIVKKGQAIICENIDRDKMAKEIKDWYQDELNIHRKTGNYGYEITPTMVSDAFKKGFNFGINNK